MTNTLTAKQQEILDSMHTSRQFRGAFIENQKQLFMLYNSECALGRPFSEKILQTLTDEQRFELLRDDEFVEGDREALLYKFWLTNGDYLGEKLSPLSREDIQTRLEFACLRVERALDRNIGDNTYRDVVEYLAKGFVGEVLCSVHGECFKLDQFFKDSVVREVTLGLQKIALDYSCKRLFKASVLDALDELFAKCSIHEQTNYDQKLLDEFFAKIESLHDKDGSDSFTDGVISKVATGYIASLVVKHGCTVAGCASFLTEMKSVTPVAETTIVAKTWHDTYKDTVFKALQDAIDSVVDEDGRWKYVPFKRYYKPLQATDIANTAVERGDIEEVVCAAMPKLLAPDEEEKTTTTQTGG